MRGGTQFRSLAAGTALLVLAAAACAGETDTASAWADDPGLFHSGELKPYVLAAGDDVNTPAKANATVSTGVPPVAPREEKNPWFTPSKAHEYLGLGTIALALATMATAPDDCEGGCASQSQKPEPHRSLGMATRAMALATVATGLAFHWDDMHLFADGLKDPDTQHWLLGGGGALILADAVRRAPAKSHSGEAELGALMMLVAIKLTW
jgi:hypothetical protein